MPDWNDKQPIFQQIKELVEKQILLGIWSEGSALPSVRAVAADMKINHLTVMKAYQLLVDQQLIEKKRGQGMYILPGALEKLKTNKTQQFLDTEIPRIVQMLKCIDMPCNDFIKALKKQIEEQQ